MNAVDALKLTRLVAALVPGTKLTQETPAAWALILDDVSLKDATTAVRAVYRDQGNDREFGARRLEADDILREVRRMRAARVTDGPPYVPSSSDLSAIEQIREQRAHWHAVADGRTPSTVALPQSGPRRPLRVLTKRVDTA